MTVQRLFLLRGLVRVALGSAEPPVLDEGEQVQFELLRPVDAAPVSWRIRLGDLLPERPQGIDLGEVVRWERAPYFESCRGQVRVVLESNSDPDAAPFGSDGWEAASARSPLKDHRRSMGSNARRPRNGSCRFGKRFDRQGGRREVARYSSAHATRRRRRGAALDWSISSQWHALPNNPTAFFALPQIGLLTQFVG